MEVSLAFARSHVSTAICTITAQHSLSPTSLSGVSLRLVVKIFPSYLHEIVGRKRQVSAFHISDKICEVRPILSAGWVMSPY